MKREETKTVREWIALADKLEDQDDSGSVDLWETIHEVCHGLPYTDSVTLTIPDSWGPYLL